MVDSLTDYMPPNESKTSRRLRARKPLVARTTNGYLSHVFGRSIARAMISTARDGAIASF
jgi:glycine cleavage system aminomethyltransferase T